MASRRMLRGQGTVRPSPDSFDRCLGTGRPFASLPGAAESDAGSLSICLHSPHLMVARGLAPGAAVVGFGAAVWHLWMPASLVLVASGLGGVFLYRGYPARLERDNAMDKPAQ